MERLPIASLVGIEARQQFQCLDFGIIAAPERGQRLQFGNDLGLLHVAVREPQRYVQQAAARGGHLVARFGGGMIGFERVLAASVAFGEPPRQHRNAWLQFLWHAERLELAELFGGPGKIAGLDRCPHGFEHDLTLELDRQGSDGGLGLLEILARFRPFALLGIGKRTPQLRIVLVADQGTGKVRKTLLDATHHDVGNGADDETAGILRRRMILRECHIEYALGFGIHFAGKIETRKLEARRQALVVRRCRGGGDQ